MTFWQAILLGIIEGVTEFLPISSTGHLIIAERVLDIRASSFTLMFDVVVQLGAILAVVVYFWPKLLPRGFFANSEVRYATFDLWGKTVAAVFPAVVIGLLLNRWMEEHLFTPQVVAGALIVGGILLFILDRPRRNRVLLDRIGDMSYGQAALVGLAQCLAMVPGTSRSAATIMGGLALGFSRNLAAEFSFFLAIPTMFGASLLKIVKHGLHLTGQEWLVAGIGVLTAFFVALGVIAFFMNYIKRHNFDAFAWYRLALGVGIIIYFGF